MMDFILHLSPGYLYPALFVGVSFLGGLVLVPALYLTISGPVNLAYLFAVVLLASVNSDTLWYVIGRKAKKDHLYRIPLIKKRIQEAEKFSTFFQKHSLWLLYVTKFIYGTRIASHVLAGMHRVRYLPFLLSTGLGTTSWFGIFYLLTHALNYGIGTTQSAALRIQLMMLLGAIIILILNWVTGKYLKAKLLKPGERKE